MLEESTNIADSYLAANRDHDANREILESGDYFQSAEVKILPALKPTNLAIFLTKLRKRQKSSEMIPSILWVSASGLSGPDLVHIVSV